MAAPTLGKVHAGGTDATGAWGVSGESGYTAGRIVILQIVEDGTPSGFAVTDWGVSSVESLAGTDNTMDYLGAFAIGSPTAAWQHLWIGRTIGTTMGPGGTNTNGNDLYWRIYEFADCSSGTTVATVIENGTAGATANGVGTSATVDDTAVTTLGPDRLALNFVGGNDDNALDDFAGETGGDWVEATAEFATATGTDAVLQLQTATMASAATIDGGSDAWADAGDSWGVVGFALIGTTVASSPSLVWQPAAPTRYRL